MQANDEMSLAAVAEYLTLPQETLYKFVRQGRIPAKKADGRWTFTRRQVDDWVAEHSNVKPRNLRVLVVDDELGIREVFARLLERGGYAVSVAADGVDAVDMFRNSPHDLVFLDLKMPRLNGVETLRELRKMTPTVDVVIVTGYYDSELMDEALSMGPIRVLRKPADASALLQVANSCAKRLGMRVPSLAS